MSSMEIQINQLLDARKYDEVVIEHELMKTFTLFIGPNRLI